MQRRKPEFNERLQVKNQVQATEPVTGRDGHGNRKSLPWGRKLGSEVKVVVFFIQKNKPADLLDCINYV